MGKFDIISDRIKHLREIHGISQHKLAKETGLSYGAILRIEGKKGIPYGKTLILFADYFNVSVDYILGRVDIDDALYKCEIDELCEKSYRRYLKDQRKGDDNYGLEFQSTDPIAPWPYNLLDYSLLKDQFIFPLSEKQYEGLKHVLDHSLTDRESKYVRAYFEKGLTFNKIASQEGLSKERIRQVIVKSVRKIRHPSNANIIKYGIDYTNIKDNILSYESEVARLNEMKEYIESQGEKIKKEYEEITKTENKHVTLDSMNLPVRSYNAIVRTLGKPGCEISPEDIITELFQTGVIYYMRNVGAKSIEDIRRALHDCGFTNSDMASPVELKLDDSWKVTYLSNNMVKSVCKK